MQKRFDSMAWFIKLCNVFASIIGKSEFPEVVYANRSAEYGNGDFGNMQSVMRRTLGGM